MCLRRRLAGWLLRTLAAKVIAISPADAKSIGGASSSKVKIVYNPYNTDELNPERYNQAEEKKRLGFSDTTKIILSLGGVGSRKGTVELIEAMREQEDDTVLLFAGPALKWTKFFLSKQSLQYLRKKKLPKSMITALKQLKHQEFTTEEAFIHAVEKLIGKDANFRYQKQIVASALNISRQKHVNVALTLESWLVKMGLKKHFSLYYSERVKLVLSRLDRDCVRFIGELTNVAPVLAACDVLAFAGTFPHFPRPVYEAGLMKKPVVVFDMQGVSDHVEDGVTGIIVNERTGQALGKAFCELLKNPQKMVSMGDAGYKKAQAFPSHSEMASSVLALYHEIVSCIPHEES